MRFSAFRFPRIHHSLWLWVTVVGFLAVEWSTVFRLDMRHSLAMVCTRPDLLWAAISGYAQNNNVACTIHTLSDGQDAVLVLRTWIVLTLSVAIFGGAVVYVCLKWLVDLWRERESAGRLVRIVRIVLRVTLFGAILALLSPPDPGWDLGCFTGRISLAGTSVPIFAVCGFVFSTMWALQFRVESLGVDSAGQELFLSYMELRHKLQVLMSLISLLFVAGVVLLLLRREVVDLGSPANLWPRQAILLRGIEYSVLLSVAYAPIHSSINAVGCRIRESAMQRTSAIDASSIQ
jgi:hypothetical protein